MEIEIQRKYAQLQALEEKIKAFIVEKENAENFIEEMQKTISSLENMKKDTSKVLSNIGSGVLIFSKLENVEEVLVNIGCEVYAKKKRIDAIVFLQEKLKDVARYYNRIGEQLSRLIEQYEKTKTELEHMIEKNRSGIEGG